MKRTIAAGMLLAMTLALSPAHAMAPEDDPEAAAQIGALVTAFQAAIVAKDRAALEAMFLAQDNSWLTVASPRAKVKPGQTHLRTSTYGRFVEFVGTSKEAIEERFHNVRIHTNGSIGTVYFDFEFLVDGKVTNMGSESWHLVKTETGWKISSMVYSIG